jgi:hypothetical protein
MIIGLDVPQRVVIGWVFVACYLIISWTSERAGKEADLLLFKSPLGKLDLVREQITSTERMP